jgi:DNA polymerase
MDMMFLDFETYWSDDFTLKKIQTDAYVLDERFKVHCVAVWHSVAHKGGRPAVFTDSTFRHYAKSIDWQRTAVCAHNVAFDGFILRHHYGITPAFWFDTLSMARALIGADVGGSLEKVARHYELGVKGKEVMNTKGKVDIPMHELQQLASYCRNDVELCRAAFARMKPMFLTSEFRLMDITTRMFVEPVVELDTELLVNHLAELGDEKRRLLAECGMDDRTLLMSNPALAHLLDLYGVDTPMKVSPTTGKQTYAFAKSDRAFTALLEHENDTVRALIEARLSVKSTIDETRAQRLLDVARVNRPLPVMINYYGASTTGRWSGANKMNMQNLRRGGTLRRAIKAPPRMKHVVADSSQIEARLVAFVAGQSDLVDAFRNKEDVYSKMASSLYGKPIDKDRNPDERFVGKTVVLGCGFGMGAAKFKEMMRQKGKDIPDAEAQRIINVYRKVNHRIVALWQTLSADLSRIALGVDMDHGFYSVSKNGIHLPNGLTIRYPGLIQTQDGWIYNQKGKVTRIYGGKATENLIQALARIVVGEQMVRIDDYVRRIGGRVWLMAHDEVCTVVPEDCAEEAKAKMLQIMSVPPAWAPDLPVAAEAGIGDNYAEAK